jgi:pimeloyl-ACP methyl ester carboxylesterase
LHRAAHVATILSVEPLPIVLVPALLCSPRLYAGQLPELWRHGPVTIADQRHDDSMAALARRILATAPPRFACAGLSMGGYIALEILRQAPERVAKLALLDTSARPDTPEQSALRRERVATARTEGIEAVALSNFERSVHPSHRDDEQLRSIVRTMALEVGVEAFVRQQAAIMSRPDSRPSLSLIRCPTLVLVGDGDELTPPELAAELAGAIPGARLVTVPGAGHLSSLEQPAAVSRALVELLES